MISSIYLGGLGPWPMVILSDMRFNHKLYSRHTVQYIITYPFSNFNSTVASLKFGNDKYFHPTLSWAWDYLSIQEMVCFCVLLRFDTSTHKNVSIFVGYYTCEQKIIPKYTYTYQGPHEAFHRLLTGAASINQRLTKPTSGLGHGDVITPTQNSGM